MKKLLLLICLMLVICGCGQQRSAHQRYMDIVLREPPIMCGMTMEQVRAAWGEPLEIKRYGYSWEKTERWTYGEGDEPCICADFSVGILAYYHLCNN